MKDSVFRFKEEAFVMRETDNEMVLVPMSNNIVDMTTVLTLNETAAEILKNLDGKRSISDVYNIISDKYDIENTILENDVIQFVENAKNRNIIVEII